MIYLVIKNRWSGKVTHEIEILNLESLRMYPDIECINGILSMKLRLLYNDKLYATIDVVNSDIFSFVSKPRSDDRGLHRKKIGRPIMTKERIPASFMKHYPKYEENGISISEYARLCNLSRPTVYKYIKLLNTPSTEEVHHAANEDQ